MMSFDDFQNSLNSSVNEENDEVRPFVPLMVETGYGAKMLLSRIAEEGAEKVLDDILKDNPDTRASAAVPDENYYNKLQIQNNAIFWSKSGVEPFVGVYEIGSYGGDTEIQQGYEDENMQREPEIEANEEQINNVNREAVESASYFLLKGFDEGTVNRVVDDACSKCMETEEALSMVRNIIKEDPRLSAYALDEDEENSYNEYRHALRKKFMGKNEDVIDPRMYELDLGGSLGEPEMGEEPVDPQEQVKIAELQAEIAELEAEHAKEMESLKQDLSRLTGEDSMLEKTDPNKGSQIAGFRHQAGPQALSNSISQMEWSGPGSEFDLFLNEITVDGYNMLGRASAGEEPEQVDQKVEPNAVQGSPELQSPVEPDTELGGNDVDLSSL